MTFREVVIVGYDGVQMVEIACVTSAFDSANRFGAAPEYRFFVCSAGGADIRCDSGLTMRAQRELEAVRSVDTLIVSGGQGYRSAADDTELIKQVRRLAERSRRVASVCTGATILAEAGLLDGRWATTHWWYAEELARDYPAVSVDGAPIFIRDGRLATSGGVTAALDLTLAFIEEDNGPEVARSVAVTMVAYLQRPGNQTQLSVFTTSVRADHATVRRVIDHAVAHPETDLSTAALASHAGVSARQLTRLFREHVGEPPATAVRRIRIEIAAQLAVTSDMPLSQVARRCGFGSAESLRQAFVAMYGVSPRSFRQARNRPAHQRSVHGDPVG